MVGNRSKARAAAATFILAGMFVGATASADAARTADSSASCRDEVRRVAVMPVGGNPKSPWMPRYENRTVTVCDGKVISGKPASDARSGKGA